MTREHEKLEREWDWLWGYAQRVGRYAGSSTTCLEIPQELYDDISRCAALIRAERAKEAMDAVSSYG